MTAADEGQWACTCGEWHDPDQPSCQNGKQILDVGDDWL